MPASPASIFQDQPDQLGREQILPLGASLGDGGRYRIVDIVAIGGMATVYQTCDTRLNTLCAVKALYLGATRCEPGEEEAAFEREAQLLAAIRHPGIVTVRDYFVEDDFAFLVMEFVDGQNLYDRHRRTGRMGEDTDDLPISPVSEDQVALYACALAEALDHLHTRAPVIVYRDMKPHNVMRRASDGRIILLDFGIARRLRPRARGCATDDLGTPGYAAPEQYDPQGRIDARTDLYSLGVVLTELATGYNPRAEGAPRFLPPLESLDAPVSPAFARILAKCAAVEPSERFQSARELLDALEYWQRTPRAVRQRGTPEYAWTFDCQGRAAGAIFASAATGRIYVADTTGCVTGVNASTGQVECVQELPTADRAVSSRYSLCAHLPGDKDSAPLLALTAVRAEGVSLIVSDACLMPQRRVNFPVGKLLACWSDGGALLTCSTDPVPVVAMMTPDGRGDWAWVWRAKLNERPVAAIAYEGGIVVLSASGATTRIAATGDTLWRRATAGRTSARVMVLVGDTLVIGGAKDDPSLAAVDAATGEPVWRAPGVGIPLSAPLASASGEMLIVPTRDAGLALVSSDGGAVVERIIAPFPRALVGASQTAAGTDVVALAEYGYGARIMLFDLDRRAVIWAAPLGEMGGVAAPVVCGESLIAQDISGRLHAWSWETRRR